MKVLAVISVVACLLPLASNVAQAAEYGGVLQGLERFFGGCSVFTFCSRINSWLDGTGQEIQSAGNTTVNAGSVFIVDFLDALCLNNRMEIDAEFGEVKEAAQDEGDRWFFPAANPFRVLCSRISSVLTSNLPTSALNFTTSDTISSVFAALCK